MSEGRGRLSSLDLLTEEAADDVIWALGQLNERARMQSDILFELNDRLAVKGLGPVSKSAFSRKAVRLAARQRRLDEARHIFRGVAENFTPERIDESNIGLAETIKMLINELLDNPNQTTKGAAELAQAFRATVSAQKMSSERRQKLQAEFESKTEAVIERVAKETGLSAERAAQIRRDVLGVRVMPPKVPGQSVPLIRPGEA